MNAQLDTQAGINEHAVVSEQAWLDASRAHLVIEKELTHFREKVSQLRRQLPWTKVEKEYVFDGPNGKVSLADLFQGKSQLVAYHFMYAPGDEEGCPGCSFVSDHVDAARQHFEHNDLAFAAISRAPFEEFQAFKARMGWSFQWVSSAPNSFSYDHQASFHRADLDSGPVLYNFTMQKLKGQDQPGLTVFYKDADGTIYRTYSTYERGLDALLGAYQYLDLAPKGRNESGPMSWVNFHDKY